MRPVRLEIRNFLAYRSPDALRFDGIHLACLTGSNGAGKSSLLDAITWALWGKARTRRDEDLVHLGQIEMYVQLDFEHEGSLYRVLRRRTRKGGGSGSLDLFVHQDGQLRTLNEGGARATQERINRLLRLEYETFIHSAFLQQGKADAFTTRPPADRKKILADILGLDRWETFEKAAKTRLQEITDNIRQTEGSISEIEQVLATEPALKAGLATAETTAEIARAALESAEILLNEVKDAPADLRAAKGRRAALIQRLHEVRRSWKAAVRQIQASRRKATELLGIIDARPDIERGYATLQAARQIDHLLGDKLMQLDELNRRRHALELEMNDVRTELIAKAAGFEEAIRRLRQTVESGQPAELGRVEAEITALEGLEQQRETLQAALVGLERERSELYAHNQTLRTEMNTLKDRISRLSEAQGAVCPLCGQPLDEASRAQLIETLQVDGKTRGDTFRAQQSRIDDIGGDLGQHEKAIAELTREIKRLAALRERAAALRTGVEAANDAALRLDEAQVGLDAVQHALDAADFAHELRAEIAGIEAQRDALGYDGAQHSSARQDLNTYSDYDQRQRELEAALAALPNVEETLAGHQARRAEFRADYAAALDECTTLDTEIGHLTARAELCFKREADVAEKRAAERKANEVLVVARQNLHALDASRARRATLLTRLDAYREAWSEMEELRESFSKRGIPALIIETVIPELEASANALLTRMTDGRMHLSMTTQREKISGGGGPIETLDIQIADELGTRSYEMYSGGEAFRINFAIRVALSQLLARRAGAHLSTLFIDEGFGTQDEDGRNKLVEAITAIQDEFDLILVITHIDELRDSFPVHIIVDKGGEGSRVRLR